MSIVSLASHRLLALISPHIFSCFGKDIGHAIFPRSLRELAKHCALSSAVRSLERRACGLGRLRQACFREALVDATPDGGQCSDDGGLR